MSEHVVDELHGYASGHLTAQEVSRVEEHLRECAECQEEADALDALGRTLSVPSSSLFAKLWTKLAGTGRFEHLLEKLAKLFDISVNEARALLARVDDPGAWESQLAPGVWLSPVEAGPACDGAFTVLVRIEPGAVFPTHTHGGEEQVFILEGGYLDVGGKEYWRGELDVRPKGSSHSFTGLPGQGCLCAARMYPVAGEGA